jgi:hypothetical protein
MKMEDGTIKPWARVLWSPVIEMRGEYVHLDGTPKGWRGYKYPLQTFKEQTGGKDWSELGSAKNSPVSSLDQTFAHEYGHFLVQAWAVNHGRNSLQTYMFAEFFAELFRTVCWGSLYDIPSFIEFDFKRIEEAKLLDPEKPFIGLKSYANDSRRYPDLQYGLYSFQELIVWEKYNKRYDSDKLIRAVFSTMKAMTGRIIKDYPANSGIDGKPLMEMLPWSKDMSPEMVQQAPMMFTRQEFLEKFCDHYECDETIKEVIAADAEGTRKTEW